MSFITNADRARIEESIAEAEKKTSGEFVAVVAHESDHYLFFSALWAALAALVVPGAMLAASADLGLLVVYAIQLAAFLVVGGILLWSPAKIRFVPKPLRRAHAARAAHEQFHARGIHRTRNHSGVLFYVSVAEHHVQIIADEGIHPEVGEARWQEIIETFAREVKARRVADGFSKAIHAIADAMAPHYPREADDVNELPDRLIEL
jgi:putative membrane protein